MIDAGKNSGFERTRNWRVVRVTTTLGTLLQKTKKLSGISREIKRDFLVEKKNKCQKSRG